MDRVPLSSEELTIKEIEDYYLATERALRSFYDKSNTYFVGYTFDELESELNSRLEELNKATAFTVLAAIEAHLRVDFLQRVYNKDKDDLSRKFRALHNEKGSRVSLSEDILELWKDHVAKKSVVQDIRAALNFRHWLAHGRYWVAKLGRRYDFASVLTLAVYAQNVTNIDMGA